MSWWKFIIRNDHQSSQQKIAYRLYSLMNLMAHTKPDNMHTWIFLAANWMYSHNFWWTQHYLFFLSLIKLSLPPLLFPAAPLSLSVCVSIVMPSPFSLETSWWIYIYISFQKKIILTSMVLVVKIKARQKFECNNETGHITQIVSKNIKYEISIDWMPWMSREYFACCWGSWQRS